MTAAKMVLQDWQRGKIPFFVPPPQQEDEAPQDKSTSSDAGEKQTTVSTDRKAAALKAIQGIISSQQKMHVPAQKDLFIDESKPEKENSDEAEGEDLEEPVVEAKGEDVDVPAADTD